MKVVLQRVREGYVAINGEKIARIGRGYVLLVGVTQEGYDHQEKDEKAEQAKRHNKYESELAFSIDGANKVL